MFTFYRVPKVLFTEDCFWNVSTDAKLLYGMPIKKYRLLKDLTQEQLAAQVGVRRETIMRLEKAQYNPSLKLAIDIARVVEAPIEEIFVFK